MEKGAKIAKVQLLKKLGEVMQVRSNKSGAGKTVFLVDFTDMTLINRSVRFVESLCAEGYSCILHAVGLSEVAHFDPDMSADSIADKITRLLKPAEVVAEEISRFHFKLDDVEDASWSACEEASPDILISFDLQSIQICEKLGCRLNDTGKRVLLFHDQTVAVLRQEEALDNYQSLMSTIYHSSLLKLDGCFTHNDNISSSVFENIMVANPPTVLPELPSKQRTSEVFEPGRKYGSTRVLYLGSTRQSDFLRELMNMVCPQHQLVILEENAQRQEFLRGVLPEGAKQSSLKFISSSKSVRLGKSVADVDIILHSDDAPWQETRLCFWLTHAARKQTISVLPASMNARDSIQSFDQKLILKWDPNDMYNFGLDSLQNLLIQRAASKTVSKAKPSVNGIKCWEESSAPALIQLIESLHWRLEKRPPVETKANLKDLRVLHGLTGGAGMPWMLSRAQRSVGIWADAFCADGNKFAYRADKIELDISFDALCRFMKSHANSYDVFQFYFRSYFFNKIVLSYPTAMDLLALKASGKRILFYFMGSEIRFHSQFQKFSPFNYVDEAPGNVSNFPEKSQRLMYEFFENIADGIAVSDPEMQSYVPEASIIERPLNLGDWPVEPDWGNERPIVVHAPSRQAVKGSAFVIKAVEELKAEGLNFEFKLVENLPQNQAKELYKRADVIVDQLRIGWYGFLSVEAMAMGKPVVCYIRDDLLNTFGADGPPLAVADPITVKNVLRKLILDKELRRQIGQKGRRFVENVHAKEIVNEKFISLYENAIRSPKVPDMNVIAKFLMHQNDYREKETQRLRAKAGL